MWLQQKLNPAPPDPVQAKIFMFFPIFLTVITSSFSKWAWLFTGVQIMYYKCTTVYCNEKEPKLKQFKLMNLEKIIPKDGPSIEEVKKYIKKYSNELIVIKCGGSVLLDENLFNQFIEDISVINKLGLSAIVVHGGGKNIKKKLDKHNIESKFIDGLRVTDEKTIKIVEEALLELNTEILNNINNKEANAQSVTPKNENIIKIIPEKKELGFVGSPKEINKDYF